MYCVSLPLTLHDNNCVQNTHRRLAKFPPDPLLGYKRR